MPQIHKPVYRILDESYVGPIACIGCRFANEVAAGGMSTLQCRRFPPAARPYLHTTVYAFPIVKPDDWCGEFLTKDLPRGNRDK